MYEGGKEYRLGSGSSIFNNIVLELGLLVNECLKSLAVDM